MSKETEEKKEEELVVVEDAPAAEDKKPEEEKKPAAEASDDDEDDDEEDEKEPAEEGDARAATDADADNEAGRQKKRKTSKERRARQRAYAERRERELNYYASRNAVLEKQVAEIDKRQRRSEGITIGQAISHVDAQIKEAERLEAEAIEAKKGPEAVEARSIRESLMGKRERLVAAAERAKQPPPDTSSTTPPPEMQAAMDWIGRNKTWYDPKGRDEDSALAQTIEDRMTREGKFNPATDEFWEELDRRLQARGVGKRTKAGVQDADDDDADDEVEVEAEEKPAAKAAAKPPAKKPSGGPRVTVNGSQRSLKANEVYVSPERKAAMIEAGVWDDPVSRQRVLRNYQEYDRNHK